MTVSLTKGGNVKLEKSGGGTLNKVILGLGWDARTTDGVKFDLDASAIGAKADGKILSDDFFVFFNNLKSGDGSILHSGDNLTGEGDGDDEQITVNLAALPADIDKIVFPVTIFDGVKNGQSFGQVKNAYIRALDGDTQEELARYDLSEDAATETVMIFGEVYRNNGGWKFRAIGEGYASGLAGIATEYGVNV